LFADRLTTQGVDVIITNFCKIVNFRQNLGVFLKSQCNDQIFAKTRKYFCQICENIFKIMKGRIWAVFKNDYLNGQEEN
jgi:hypothetical protein